MRILQLHTQYRQPGGEDRVVENEATLLRTAGHDVRTLLARNPDDTRSVGTFAAAPWNPAALRRIRREAEAYQPDVVHVHNTWFAMSPAVFTPLQELSIPVVMSLHNYRLICAAGTLFRDGAPCEDCVGSHPWHAVRHRCYRRSAPSSAIAAATIALHRRLGTWQDRVNHYLALTEFGRQEFIAAGLPGDRISVKSNSVEDPGPRTELPSRSDKVVFVGRLSEEKGAHVLLEAWASTDLDLRLVVVGGGPLEPLLRRQAPSSVEFLGSLPTAAVRELLLTARALVFPSICFEGQGLVALEAAAAALPVLASDLGAMAGLFAPGADDLLVKAGDVIALGEGLRQLQDGRFVDDRGRFTRRVYEERYTPVVALHALERAYRTAFRKAG
jgi:glycosyltransferase involved in cell wall biosynthesis